MAIPPALALVFGCWHRNLSRPFRLSGWTQEVCPNCGKKLAYNRLKLEIHLRRGGGYRFGRRW